MSSAVVQLVYMEPTPYILGLIERLAQRWPGPLRVHFAASDATQPWGKQATSVAYEILPQGLAAHLAFVRSKITAQQCTLVHMGSWSGAPVMPLTLLQGWCTRIPVTVESDTIAVPGKLTGMKRTLKRLLYPLLFRIPAHFFPGGARQAEYLASYGVPRERISIAHMTVDVTALSRYRSSLSHADREERRQTFGLDPGDCVFLYVGRLEHYKGLGDLLEAFKLLDTKGNPARLLVVGGGTLQTMLVDAAMSDPRMICTGRLSGDALLDAYAAADVFVLPSRFEPWGLVVNEAMAAGLPVLATERVGAVDDLVKPGSTGLVVPAAEPAALGQAMQRLLDNVDLRITMGLAASRLIADWTLEREADIIVAGWQSVVKSS